MTDRDSGGGGMTGATGDLTPDDAQREFEPGELREASDPMHRADGTRAQTGETEDAGAEPELRPDREPWVGGDERTDQEEHF